MAILVPPSGLSGGLKAAIFGVVIAGLGTVIALVLQMGTVVADDRITRRGFLGDRHYGWSDIRDFHLHDNNVVVKAFGVQVTSRYVVAVYDHHHARRRKTLFFFDERAFPTVHAFQAELNDVIHLWERQRATT